MNASTTLPPTILGRYAIHEEIAAGGMATVHLGRRLGPVGFARTVAIKRLHVHLAREPEFVAMFLDEARLAARVRHPNVVPILDVVTAHGEPFLVMEYVQGESLARLLTSLRQRGGNVSTAIACSVVVGMLQGLHAAHEASDERGGLLGIVHRDVSPQNVLVGLDGVTRVLDFGVAKAAGRLQTTREGQLKGKLGYTAPELIRGHAVTRAADVYSAAVVFWETLTGERLFAGDNDANILERVLFAEVAPPSRYSKHLGPELDAIVLRALDRDPARRFGTAREMARAIESVIPIAVAAEVGEWVETLADVALAERARKMARIESSTHTESHPGDAVGWPAPDDSGEIPASAPRTDPSAFRAAEPIEAPKSWRRPLLLVFAAAVLGAIAFVISFRSPGGAKASGTSAPATEPGGPAHRVAVPAPSVGPPASASEPPTVSADELPMAATSSPRHTAPSSGRISPPPRSASSAQSSSSAKSSCDPPWAIDSRGIKQYKLQCL